MEHHKQPKICINGITKVQERDGDMEKMFKSIMAENFSNLIKTINLEIQDTQGIASRSNRGWGEIIPRHIIIKLLKTSDEEKNLKTCQRGKILYTEE